MIIKMLYFDMEIRLRVLFHPPCTRNYKIRINHLPTRKNLLTLSIGSDDIIRPSQLNNDYKKCFDKTIYNELNTINLKPIGILTSCDCMLLIYFVPTYSNSLIEFIIK